LKRVQLENLGFTFDFVHFGFFSLVQLFISGNFEKKG